MLMRYPWRIALVILMSLWAAFEVWSATSSFGYVPRKFGLSWPYREGSCGGFLDYEGAFAVGLDRKTLQGIRAEGLRWFADVGPPRDQSRAVYFDHWHPTPLPDDAWRNGTPYDLDCAEKHSWAWPATINDNLKRPGSHYSESEGRFAYVVPKLGLIVVALHTR